MDAAGRPLGLPRATSLPSCVGGPTLLPTWRHSASFCDSSRKVLTYRGRGGGDGLWAREQSGEGGALWERGEEQSTRREPHPERDMRVATCAAWGRMCMGGPQRCGPASVTGRGARGLSTHLKWVGSGAHQETPTHPGPSCIAVPAVRPPSALGLLLLAYHACVTAHLHTSHIPVYRVVGLGQTLEAVPSCSRACALAFFRGRQQAHVGTPAPAAHWPGRAGGTQHSAHGRPRRGLMARQHWESAAPCGA